MRFIQAVIEQRLDPTFQEDVSKLREKLADAFELAKKNFKKMLSKKYPELAIANHLLTEQLSSVLMLLL